MTKICTGLLLFFSLLLTCNLATAQSANEKVDISSTGIWVAPGDGQEREKNFPVHVSHLLREQPEAQETLRKYNELERRYKLGYGVQSVETTADIGDTITINLYNFEKTEGRNPIFDKVDMKLMAAGNLSEIWVEIDELGPEKITQKSIDLMLKALEDETSERSINPGNGIIENNRMLFGDPPDMVDNSGKVKVYLANIQDGWNSEDGGGYTAGFFYPADQDPSNPNSNEGNIIYINTYPEVYTDDRQADPQNSLSTIAHEYQHLVHWRYNKLNIFQNEGQSELAEILNGFDARPMAFLDDPEEINGGENTTGLFRWRTDDADEVLKDYQRAGLLHSYLSERVGPYNAGRLTQAPREGRRGYESVLTGEGIAWEDFLTEFYVANWVNDKNIDKRFGYDLPQFRNLQASNAGITFNSSTDTDWVRNQKVTIGYGGASYANWFGLRNLEVEVSKTEGIFHYLISREQRDSKPSIMPLNDYIKLNGTYELITLVSVNTARTSSRANSQTFGLTANWDRTNLAEKEYLYYTDVRFLTPLIGESDTNETVYSLRITPEYDGNINSVFFNINDRAESITGEGTLRITLLTSQSYGVGKDEIRIPADTIAYNDVAFSNINRGETHVSVDVTAWAVNKDEDYHVTFDIIEAPEARLEFLLDSGICSKYNDFDGETSPVCQERYNYQEEDEEYSNFYPPRTVINVGNQPNWTFYNDRHNILAGINLLYPDDSIDDQKGSDPPYADTFELEQNFPNPFQAGTTIRYNIVDDVPVKLEIFDVLGRKVQTLVDDSNQEPGSYDIEFDGSSLSSGIYLYRLRAGDFVKTAKMTLTK